MIKDLEGYSISTGVVRDRTRAYLLTTKDTLIRESVPHTRIYSLIRGKWGGWDIYDWMACSCSMCHVPREQFITIGQGAIGQPGRARLIGGGEDIVETVGQGQFSPETRGPLREVRGIAGGRAYAVGTCRQAYRRDAPNTWSCIDQTAQTKDRNITDTSFESIDGFNEEEIYAVGWEGEIWQYDGKKWRPIPSPTNLALHKVRCGDDGFVYASGQVGTLLRGRGTRWEVIEHGVTEQDIWGLEWFNGRLYLATLHLLYVLEQSTLSLVDFGEADIPGTCYHLSAADGVMWSIGAKDVMQFDGTAWSRILALE